MARLARIVIAHVAHHVTQAAGQPELSVLFSDADRQACLALLAGAARTGGTTCLAWCLMDNHLHLILAPGSADRLRATFSEAHWRRTRLVNFRAGWRGHLFQRRFASCPIDDAHLMVAVRRPDTRFVPVKRIADQSVLIKGNVPFSYLPARRNQAHLIEKGDASLFPTWLKGKRTLFLAVEALTWLKGSDPFFLSRLKKQRASRGWC